MYKLATWLWTMAERSTARAIIDMLNSFYQVPVVPTDERDQLAVKRYALQKQSFHDAMRFRHMVESRFFPEQFEKNHPEPKQ